MPAQRPGTGRCGACTISRQQAFVWRRLHCAAPPASAHAQGVTEETPSGPDGPETGQGPRGHLFGNRGGLHSHLSERGVRLNFQYISDSLWNLRSEQPARFASWSRLRWPVEVDFAALTGRHGLYFRATAFCQGGSNLGACLGLLTSASSMSNATLLRLFHPRANGLRAGQLVYGLRVDRPSTSDGVRRHSTAQPIREVDGRS